MSDKEEIQPVNETYMNPISLEAEIFAYNLEALMETNHQVDEILLSSLKKLMISIEEFIDSNAGEIVETKKSQLVKSFDVSQIVRSYECKKCHRHMGKSAEKAALHLMTCKKFKPDETSIQIELKPLRRQLCKETGKIKKELQCYPTADLEGIQTLFSFNLDNFIMRTLQDGVDTKYLQWHDSLIEQLLSFIIPLFPTENVKIYKYGSRMSGIGGHRANLNLYVDIGNTFHQYQTHVTDELRLKYHKVALALRSHYDWEKLQIFNYHRVPHLQVSRRGYGTLTYLTFNNGLGVMNTKYLEYIFNIQPIAQALCIFMRKWLIETKLLHFLNTYSMVLMVLFYLQNLKAIPSMEQLQDYIKPQDALYVGPWLCSFSSFTHSELDMEADSLVGANLLLYIKGFFNFYKSFNFKNNIICPYLGKAVKKLNVHNAMPSRYTEFVEKFPESRLQANTAIVVQDPIELNHNTTKNLPLTFVLTFKYFVISSLEILNNDPIKEFVWEVPTHPRNKKQKPRAPKKRSYVKYER